MGIIDQQKAIQLQQDLQIRNRVIDASINAVVIADLKGRIEYVNPAFVRLLNYHSVAEVLERSAAESWSESGEIQKLVRFLGETGEWNGELEVKSGDGTPVHVRVSASMIRDAANTPVRLMASLVSMTGQKRAEQALSQNREDFQSIVEHAPIAMAVVSMAGVIEFINRKAVTVFGYLPEDIPTMEKWWKLAYPDEGYRREVVADWMGRIHQAFAEGGEIIGNEYRVVCKDGSQRTMFISGVPVSGKIFVMFDDITERKKAEEALAASEQKFREIANTVPIGIYEFDRTGRLTFVNTTLIEWFGYTWDEFHAGVNILDLADQADRQRLRENIGNIESMESFLPREYLLRRKNGEKIEVLALSKPILARGQLQGFRGILLDLTEKKKNEFAFQNAARLDSLGVLAGGIAHDFNNLLAGIFGYIDLARFNSRDTKVIGYLDLMMNSIGRARALTLQLLTFAKGGSPVQKITPLQPVVKEAAKFALSGSNVSCRFSLSEDLWPCNIDPNQIGQVVDNLVLNAIQAMPDGGVIEIVAANVDRQLGEQEHPRIKKGCYVKVSVKDSGIGIPKENLPRIFDPFYTTKTQGHGLGLATSYSIINRHGGWIDVESEPGQGSTFHVFLPASPGSSASRAAAGVRHKGSGTVIVADDEESVRKTFSHMLEMLGYTVVCKNDGREALEYFLDQERAGCRFAALVFDLTIPGGMGGVEAVAEIRRTNSDIPVFVASGYSDNAVMKNPAGYGFTASIAKPFTFQDLSEMLNLGMKPLAQLKGFLEN
ncbi:MAG: PAS domain S-box protein [Chitinispirillaceae bacterium]|jgi:PAS domain S-box-containing protein|nr:PAS domain S-box protein [Chitinispirillaceae bacterium]